jgi:phospholysine phosphohistidine inorganic pyrophosphate phosphatase
MAGCAVTASPSTRASAEPVMRGVLLDLDGVLYIGDQAVPGAAEVVRWLQEEQVQHLFVTNTSSRPRAAIVTKLAGLGINVEPEKVLTPAVAALSWLRDSCPGPPALFVPAGTASEFAPLGPLRDDAETGAASVVVGDLGSGWDFATLNRAFRLLMSEPRPALVALGMTRYWRAPDGLRLDTGAFVRALEYASGTAAVVMGKPAHVFFDRAVQALGLRAEEVVMVGDDVRADVGGAKEAGLAGVLVRTGKFTAADLGGDVTPSAVLDTVAGLPDWWQAHSQT